MNKNRIMIAVMLALSLGVVEPVFAAEQPKPSLVKRAEAEYKQFIGALKCWRGFRWQQCTPAQRKRVLISGAVLVVLLAGLAFISSAGVSMGQKIAKDRRRVSEEKIRVQQALQAEEQAREKQARIEQQEREEQEKKRGEYEAFRAKQEAERMAREAAGIEQSIKERQTETAQLAKLKKERKKSERKVAKRKEMAEKQAREQSKLKAREAEEAEKDKRIKESIEEGKQRERRMAERSTHSLLPSLSSRKKAAAIKTAARRKKSPRPMSEFAKGILSRRKTVLASQSGYPKRLTPLSPEIISDLSAELEDDIIANDPHALEITLSYDNTYKDVVMNLADSEGNTPLHRAVSLGRIHAVAALLESGVNMNPRNKARQTPLDLAREDIEIYELLKETGALHGPEIAIGQYY